jgi:ribose transport system substrate-binding protein
MMSLRSRPAGFGLGLALAGILLAGCTTSAADSGTGSAAGTVAKEDIVLVASVINTTNPYMASNIAGAEALAKELGVPLEIVDSEGSSQVQNSKIQAILAKGKTVVMFVNTVSSSDAPIIVEAVKNAGGYVSIWWNKPDDYEPWEVGDNFVAFQKHPGVPSGECTADKLAEALGEEGNIIALPGVQDSTTSQTRVAGLKHALETKYPNMTLLEERPSNWDPELAAKNAQDLIVKYGDEIDGVWTADDAMQIGAMKAFEDAGLLEEVKFVSDGLYPDTIADMRSGRGNNAIVGETFHRGYMASAIGLYTAYLAATGEIVPSELPQEKRNSLFKLSCVSPDELEEYTKYDDDIDGWIDELIANGPWDTEPVPLIGGGPEVMP